MYLSNKERKTKRHGKEEVIIAVLDDYRASHFQRQHKFLHKFFLLFFSHNDMVKTQYHYLEPSNPPICPQKFKFQIAQKQFVVLSLLDCL
jgi:hypothetical protein